MFFIHLVSYCFQWGYSKRNSVADDNLLELLNQKNSLLHDVHLTVDSGIREIISLIDTYDKTSQGFFRWFSCLFSSSDRDKTAPVIFIITPFVEIVRLLTASFFKWYGCYFTHMTSSKDTHYHSMAVVGSDHCLWLGFILLYWPLRPQLFLLWPLSILPWSEASKRRWSSQDGKSS